MEQDKKHEVALMRYSVISPLITGLQEEYPSMDAFFRDASLKGILSPDGSVKRYAPGTIEKLTLPGDKAKNVSGKIVVKAEHKEVEI